MGRLTLQLPATLGEGESESHTAERRGDLDESTERFLAWFDCWAGR